MGLAELCVHDLIAKAQNLLIFVIYFHGLIFFQQCGKYIFY